MEYRNFSISRAKGKLYLKEKQPKEGFEEVTYGEGKKTYHQYHNSIQGIPTEFGVKEVEHEGRKLRFLELTLIDGDVINKISVNLKSANGYTDEAKALFSALRGLELGEKVSISPSKSTYTNKKGEERTNLNVYINYLERAKDSNDRFPTTGYINFNDVPAPTSKVVAGDTTWDWTPQIEFYYSVFQEIEAKFSKGSSQQTTKKELPKVTPKQAFDTEKSFIEDDGLDLPF